MHLEPDASQTNEPDERFAALDLDRPRAKPVPSEVCLDAIRELVAGSVIEHAREVSHDLGIGVQACERLAIGIPPAPEEKPGRAVGLHANTVTRPGEREQGGRPVSECVHQERVPELDRL